MPIEVFLQPLKECGGEAAFWNNLSWDLLIIPQNGPTQLSQFTLRHRPELFV